MQLFAYFCCNFMFRVFFFVEINESYVVFIDGAWEQGKGFFFYNDFFFTKILKFLFSCLLLYLLKFYVILGVFIILNFSIILFYFFIHTLEKNEHTIDFFLFFMPFTKLLFFFFFAQQKKIFYIGFLLLLFLYIVFLLLVTN